MLFLVVSSLLRMAITDNFIEEKIHLSPTDKASLGYDEDLMLNFTQLAKKNGFYSEEHDVVTKDGYVLTLFRLGGKYCEEKQGFPVVIMHGFLLSADAWLDAGPNISLAYLLADSCFDVWVGNLRGNYYARKHIKLDPDKDAEFWQFSIDEMARYDVPGTIDYVLTATEQTKLNYIGYSQGGATLIAAISEMPAYNSKVNLHIGLAPAVRVAHMKSMPFRVLSKVFSSQEQLLQQLGVQEIFHKDSLVQTSLEYICQGAWVSKYVCLVFVGFLDNYHEGSISDRTLRRIFSHLPAGVNVQLYIHYQQMMDSDGFPKYDYGAEKNLVIYGSEQPPLYKLDNVKVPSVLFSGRADHVVPLEDVQWLVGKIPVVEFIEMKDPDWNHFDMVYSERIPTDLFPRVRKYLEQYNL